MVDECIDKIESMNHGVILPFQKNQKIYKKTYLFFKTKFKICCFLTICLLFIINWFESFVHCFLIQLRVNEHYYNCSYDFLISNNINTFIRFIYHVFKINIILIPEKRDRKEGMIVGRPYLNVWRLLVCIYMTSI